MISRKNKRKIIYGNFIYYWYIRIKTNIRKLYIISGDKKLHLECLLHLS